MAGGGGEEGGAWALGGGGGCVYLFLGDCVMMVCFLALDSYIQGPFSQ